MTNRNLNGRLIGRQARKMAIMFTAQTTRNKKARMKKTVGKSTPRSRLVNAMNGMHALKNNSTMYALHKNFPKMMRVGDNVVTYSKSGLLSCRSAATRTPVYRGMKKTLAPA